MAGKGDAEMSVNFSMCFWLPLWHGEYFYPTDHFLLTIVVLPLELISLTTVVCSPLTFVLVVAHDVFQVLQDEVPPGLLTFTLFLPVLHSFHLSPSAQGLSLPAFTVVVEEGLVIEVASGLKAGGGLSGPGHRSGVDGQRVRPCRRRETFDK